jgi:hypothetical protein
LILGDFANIEDSAVRHRLFMGVIQSCPVWASLASVRSSFPIVTFHRSGGHIRRRHFPDSSGDIWGQLGRNLTRTALYIGANHEHTKAWS